jgi:hypothetical protein
LRELGCVLSDHFEGWAVNLVERAAGSVEELVRLITGYLPGFRDEAVYKGMQVWGTLSFSHHT